MAINERDDAVLLRVRVHPNAGRSQVGRLTGGVLEVRVAAPPVKGQANSELITCLSQWLGTGKSSLTIVKGQFSRNKIIAIRGLSQDDLMRRVSA
ncbi:MAG: YggU family protein [Chloroflexi bacterium RBG_16_50_9]|nr:MAG: YggU family protein [Chloroflexi bacterium RBG_16_50_9]